MNSTLTPPFFIKFRVSFLDALSTGITFLTLVVCFPSPLDADVGKNRLRDQPKECLCVRQGAGTTVLCNFAIPFSQFTFLKLFSYTQFVVHVLYLVCVLYAVRSLQSAFYTDRKWKCWCGGRKSRDGSADVGAERNSKDKSADVIAEIVFIEV